MEPFDPAKYFHIEVSEGIFTDIYLLHKLDYILVHVITTPPAFADNLRYSDNLVFIPDSDQIIIAAALSRKVSCSCEI